MIRCNRKNIKGGNCISIMTDERKEFTDKVLDEQRTIIANKVNDYIDNMFIEQAIRQNSTTKQFTEEDKAPNEFNNISGKITKGLKILKEQLELLKKILI